MTSFERDGRTLRACALPGVPEELRVMFDGAFLPYLLTELEHDKTSAEGMLCTFGLSESKINDTLESCALGNSIAVQLMVAYPTVQITLKVDQANLIDSEKTLGVALEHVAAAIGLDNIYSHDPAVSLAEVVLGLLRKGRKTLAVAESCTGGLLSKLITDVSGASHVFLGGVTSYSNSAKQTFLDVPKAVIAEHGAVSTEVAERMAVGARRHFKSDLAVSVTGIAGPEGGSREKPVGTVFLGLATANGVQSYRVYHRSSRSHIRSFSAYYALDMIRRYVNGHAPLPETIQTIGD